MSVESALQQLASYRLKNTRESQDTFEKGLIILKSGKAAKLGDERMHVWHVLFHKRNTNNQGVLIRMGIAGAAGTSRYRHWQARCSRCMFIFSSRREARVNTNQGIRSIALSSATC